MQTLNADQLQKIEDIRERVQKSEHEGSYATVDGVDTVDDIWYLLDMVRRLTEDKGGQHGN
jgi:predicted GNAT family N-acyltransferase